MILCMHFAATLVPLNIATRGMAGNDIVGDGTAGNGRVGDDGMAGNDIVGDDIVGNEVFIYEDD